ncbi:hypothetical protein, partial [Corynebacterium propinquum]|uniref:hypothetical protein n=1 Tax=Corynebacterium propinquum TaxID=43769 RepID=UPI0011A17B1B
MRFLWSALALVAAATIAVALWISIGSASGEADVLGDGVEQQAPQETAAPDRTAPPEDREAEDDPSGDPFRD